METDQNQKKYTSEDLVYFARARRSFLQLLARKKALIEDEIASLKKSDPEDCLLPGLRLQIDGYEKYYADKIDTCRRNLNIPKSEVEFIEYQEKECAALLKKDLPLLSSYGIASMKAKVKLFL